MARSANNSVALTDSQLIETVKANLSVTDRRKLESTEKQTSRMWRNFWIEAAHRQGFTAREIAEAFDMSQANVYLITNKR